MSWSNLLFSLEGRIGRGSFWLGTLVIIVFVFVASLVLGVIVGAGGGSEEAAGLAGGIAGLISLWPGICVQGKRWHDRNKSAWWILIGLIPVVGSIWTLVECGCLKGTEGPNRFGPDPVA